MIVKALEAVRTHPVHCGTRAKHAEHKTNDADNDEKFDKCESQCGLSFCEVHIELGRLRFGGYDPIIPLRLGGTWISEEALPAEYRHIARQIVPRFAQIILELNTVYVSL